MQEREREAKSTALADQSEQEKEVKHAGWLGTCKSQANSNDKSNMGESGTESSPAVPAYATGAK
jgi:hypothetical protein